jgi:excisionase family DNA binding protein
VVEKRGQAVSALRPVDVLLDPARARQVPAADVPRYITTISALAQRAEIALGALTARVPVLWDGEAQAGPTEILDVPTVAQRLGLAPRSVHELCRTKRLPGFKVGKHWRIKAADLEVWMQRQKEVKAERPARQKQPVTVEIRRSPKETT